MSRHIWGVIAGIIVTSIAVALVQQLGHFLYPLPAEIDLKDPAAVKDFTQNAPFLALFFVIISYAVGALCGSFVASKIARDNSRAPIYILGAIFILVSLYMMSEMEPPLWFWILGVAVWALVFVGHNLAVKTSRPLENHKNIGDRDH